MTTPPAWRADVSASNYQSASSTAAFFASMLLYTRPSTYRRTSSETVAKLPLQASENAREQHDKGVKQGFLAHFYNSLGPG